MRTIDIGYGLPEDESPEERAARQQRERDDAAREVGARTGIPAVVNTSFNLAGEPMVASVADGWSTFLRTDIDALVIGPFVMERPA